MDFLVAVEVGDEKSAYGVVVPALPGCFSAGDTYEEAMANAREAIELHVESLLDAGEPKLMATRERGVEAELVLRSRSMGLDPSTCRRDCINKQYILQP